MRDNPKPEWPALGVRPQAGPQQVQAEHIRARFANLRAQARELPDDDGRRVETLVLLSDADGLLDAAERKFARAAKAYTTEHDTTERLLGGSEVVKG